MAVNDFSKKYVNFHSELNSLFKDELVQTKRDCIGLEELAEVFDIFPDRAGNEVRFIRNPESPVGATYEVEKLAVRLGKKYDLKLVFD